jgi:hypothetical protein
MVDPLALSREAEEFARLLVPELKGLPLYVVPWSTLPGAPADGACLGGTSASLAWFLRRRLGAAWRGPGPAMLVNDREVAAFEDLAGEVLRSVVVHELAHIVVRPWPFCDMEPPPRGAVTSDVVLARLGAGANATSTLRDTGRAPLEHDAGWLWLAWNLIHRARRLGLGLIENLGVGGPACGYSLSSWRAYEATLRGKPRRLASLPLEQLKRRSPPRRFTALHGRDVQNWTNHIREIAWGKAMRTLNEIDLDQLRRKAALAGAYARLVVNIAEGGDPDPEDVDAVLQSAGKTAADLRKDVGLLLDRQRCKQLLKERAALDFALEEVVLEEVKAGQELQRAKAAHAVRISELEGRRIALSYRLQQLEQAAAELARSAGAEKRLREQAERAGTVEVN